MIWLLLLPLLLVDYSSGVVIVGDGFTLGNELRGMTVSTILRDFILEEETIETVHRLLQYRWYPFRRSYLQAAMSPGRQKALFKVVKGKSKYDATLLCPDAIVTNQELARLLHISGELGRPYTGNFFSRDTAQLTSANPFTFFTNPTLHLAIMEYAIHNNWEKMESLALLRHFLRVYPDGYGLPRMIAATGKWTVPILSTFLLLHGDLPSFITEIMPEMMTKGVEMLVLAVLKTGHQSSSFPGRFVQLWSNLCWQDGPFFKDEQDLRRFIERYSIEELQTRYLAWDKPMENHIGRAAFFISALTHRYESEAIELAPLWAATQSILARQDVLSSLPRQLSVKLLARAMIFGGPSVARIASTLPPSYHPVSMLPLSQRVTEWYQMGPIRMVWKSNSPGELQKQFNNNILGVGGGTLRRAQILVQNAQDKIRFLAAQGSLPCEGAKYELKLVLVGMLYSLARKIPLDVSILRVEERWNSWDQVGDCWCSEFAGKVGCDFAEDVNLVAERFKLDHYFTPNEVIQLVKWEQRVDL